MDKKIDWDLFIKDMACTYTFNEAYRDTLVKALKRGKELDEQEDKFDVLEHLRNGGGVTDGETLFYLRDNHLVGGYHPEHPKGDVAHNIIASSVIFNKLFKDDWQPYEPKPELVDGKFYKCKMFSEDAQTFVIVDAMYRKDIAWSGRVEPILKGGKPVEVEID